MPRTASDLHPTERAFLSLLHARAVRYFLDNQTADGLFLDRQRNFDPLRAGGWCSTATTGMGFIALALASAEPFRLLSRASAAERVSRGLTTALDRVPHTRGIMPHFLDAATGTAVGADQRSTVDSAWLIAGGLWAGAFLRDERVCEMARRLSERVDWNFWTTPATATSPGLIRHGADGQGRALPCAWDRLNGETVHLYVLAAGGAESRAWPAANWRRLKPFFGTAGGLRFASADLGLFVFQYGLDLLDLQTWREPLGRDLDAEADAATEANYRVCRAAADRFETYRHYWGLSAGDGPGDVPAVDSYRSYAPGRPLDGTAHVTASLASAARRPDLVLDNLQRLRRDRRLTALGRYGFSTVNVDRRWVGRDMVGIDAGAVVLALDNYLHDDRVRTGFHSLPSVRLGLERIGFVRRSAAALNAA
jgi:hypothetical protein